MCTSARRPNRKRRWIGATREALNHGWSVLLTSLMIAGIALLGTAAWAQRLENGGGDRGFRGGSFGLRPFQNFPVQRGPGFVAPSLQDEPYRPPGGDIYLPDGSDQLPYVPRHRPGRSIRPEPLPVLHRRPPRSRPPRWLGPPEAEQQGIRPLVLPARRALKPALALKTAPARTVGPPSKPRVVPGQGRGGVPQPAPAANQAFVPDEVLFELRPNLPPRTFEAIARQYRLTPIRSDRIELIGTTIVRARIPDRRRTPEEVVRVLRADARVASAQSNGKFRLQDEAASARISSTGQASLQWAADKMQLSSVHRLTQGNDVLVAVIDSGIDMTHPELAGSSFKLVDMIDGAFKSQAHGTSMAGAIMSHAHLVGVAPGVRILELRTFDGEATAAGAEGTTDHILRALDAAYKEKANVANLSFAGPPDALLSRMLAALRQKGIVVIAAAGNGGPNSPPLYPAADPNVIAVTATDAGDALYTAANRGTYISVAAPGVDVLEPVPGGAYQLTSGTSVAAAHVSGIVALLLARNPGLSPDAVRKVLTETANKVGDGRKVEDFGSGVVDAFRALQAIEPKPADDKASSAAPAP